MKFWKSNKLYTDIHSPIKICVSSDKYSFSSQNEYMDLRNIAVENVTKTTAPTKPIDFQNIIKIFVRIKTRTYYIQYRKDSINQDSTNLWVWLNIRITSGKKTYCLHLEKHMFSFFFLFFIYDNRLKILFCFHKFFFMHFDKKKSWV